MSEVSESVHRLVEPWTLVLSADEAGEARLQEFPPLLDLLAGLVAPSNNARGGGGAVSTRNVLDVKALDLLMHIQDVVGAWSIEYRVQGFSALTLTVQTARVAGAIDALWRTEQIPEDDYVRRSGYFDRWAGQIWDLLEPPLQRPLRDSSCPRCGVAKVSNDAGEVTDSLALEHRYGQEVVAVCRAADCTAVWVGENGLKGLGRELGIEFNTDALATAENE